MKFADDLEKEEPVEQQGEQDDEAEDQDTRDRCKNRRLQKRKKAGQVPEELLSILSYLEKRSPGHDGRREPPGQARQRRTLRAVLGELLVEGNSQKVRQCQGQGQGLGRKLCGHLGVGHDHHGQGAEAGRLEHWAAA